MSKPLYITLISQKLFFHHENNDPAVALLTVRNTLLEKNIFPGNELKLGIAMRDALSYIYEV